MNFLLSFIPGAGPALVFAKANPWVGKVLAGLAVVLVLLALWFGLQAKGRHDQKLKDDAAAARALDQAKVAGAQAQAQATAEHAHDTAAVAAMKKDLTDAYASIPDSVPYGARLALACERLRHTPQARLPEFSVRCGPQGPGQTAAHH